MQSDLKRMYGVGLMAAVIFLSSLVSLPVLPRISKDLGARDADIPIVVSAALATVVLLQGFTGILSDRFSKRRMVLVGTLIGSVSSLLCAVATHWTQLVVLRVAGGIADAISMPALLAITATLGKDQPGRFFGILRSSQGLSFIAGPALGSAFSLVSLRAPFVADGLLSLLAFAAAFALVKDTERVASEHTLSVFRGLRSVFSDRRVYLYLLMGISGLFGFGALYGFVPAKSQAAGMDAWQVGLIVSGGALAFSLTSYVVGPVSDRLGRKAFVVGAEAVIVLSGVCLALSEGFWGLLASYGLFCIGEAVPYLVCFVYATEAFDPRHIGTSMGAFDSVMDLSLFLGPFAGVVVYDATGHFAPVFLMAVVPAALAVFATALWLPRRP